MYNEMMMVAAAQSTEDGLTLREVWDSVPTDPASVIVLLLLIASMVIVLWAGTRPGGRGGRPA